MKNRYVFMDEVNAGEPAAGGGAPAPLESGTVLDGGESGNGVDAPATIDDPSDVVLDGGKEGEGVQLFADKFKSVEELEKSYKETISMTTKNAEKINDLSEKLKGFSGAPDGDYEVAEGQGQFNDAIMGELSTWGKENGLSQDAFSDLLKTVHGADAAAAEATRSAEMAKLGKDADARIKNTTDSLNHIFGDELADKFLYIGQDAAGVEALEALVSRFADGTVNPDGSGFAGEAQITQDEISTMMYEKDSSGMIKMQTDPEYAKKVYAHIDKYNKQKGVA